MQKQKLFDLISLKNKKALITGAGAGIGTKIAERFAEAGADLVLIDIDFGSLIELKSELVKKGVRVDIFKTDLSRKSNIDRLWVKKQLTDVDILVNNAGIYPFKDFIDVEEKFYDKVMDINLNAVFWMAKNFIKNRIKKGGVIVNISSIEALLPFKEDLSVYSASKAGVIALTRSLAREHAKDGFRVNCLVPGGILTEGTKASAKLIFHFKKGLIKSAMRFKTRLPARRLGEPDEVARMALVLVSDLASYMHGAVVPVDGGFLSA